ncbi:MAG: hypothetical protein KY397_06265 [Gemmatimonadetes bacterium]|nr:hypothetical protein [Gemmatimonadota bacterium]
MRRVVALCLLAMFAALHADGLVAARGSNGDHHHPGCPWEMREEPCPHAGAQRAPTAPEWAPCPAEDLNRPVTMELGFLPIPALSLPAFSPPGVLEAPVPDQRTRAIPIAPDPDPPRGSFALV